MTANPAHRRAQTFAFGPFVLVPEQQSLTRSDLPVRVGNRSLDLLTALVERPGELVSKQELMARAWPDTFVEEGNLKVNLAALRRALGEEKGGPRYIETVIGSGYRFSAPVRSSRSDDAPTREEARQLGNLPRTLARLVGRAAAIRLIHEDLSAHRLASIVGPGGIGKSTIALAVANGVVGRHADGVWLVDLSPLKDAALVPHAIATAIGMTAHSANLLATVGTYLRNRDMLLVLDSCEHLIDAVAKSVQHILADAPNITILVTSREPLRLTGERVHRVPGLGTPPENVAITAAEALAFPAVQLFVERAIDRLHAFSLSDTDAPLVAEICRKLDGIALAIELAATRIEGYGVGGLLAQLDAGFRLIGGWRGGPERHRTLTTTLDWSYNLLADREATLLRAVSVFAGAFDARDAEVMAVAYDGSVAANLVQLAEKSLLAVTTADGSAVYRLLDTTRAYAIERRQFSGEDAELRRRHAEHVCVVLERSAIEWTDRPSREWAADYGRLLDDLRAALAWAGAKSHDVNLLIRLTAAGAVLWNHFSLTDESRGHLMRAIATLDDAGLSGTPTEMNLQIGLAGALMFTLGVIPPVRTAVERALEIAIRIGDTEPHLRCLRMIGLYELFVGQHDAAIATLTRFTTIARASDPTALVEGETHLAAGEMFVGQLQSARNRLERLDAECMPDFDNTRFVRFLYSKNVDVMSVASHAQWLTGSPDTARRTAIRGVDYARETAHELSLTNALAWACPVFFLNGEFAECDRYLSIFEDLSTRVGFVTWRPVAAFYRAALTCVIDDCPAEAVDALGQAVAKLRTVNHGVRIPFYLGIQADALARSGRLADARSTIEAALVSAHDQNEIWCLPEVLRIQAGILIAQGQTQEAEAVLHDSIAIAERTGALAWRLRTTIDLAKLRGGQADTYGMLLSVYGEFTEGFATRDMTLAAELLAVFKPGGSAD